MNTKQLLENTLGKGSTIIRPLIGGMMNQSYVVSDINKKEYVLYVSTEEANKLVNRDLEKENQSIVYSLGLTSKNVYFDVINGIKINEFIHGSSLDKVETFDYEKIATLFKKLHASPTLSKEDYLPFVRLAGYESNRKKYQKEDDSKYLQLRRILFENRDYLESIPKVLSHNDAQRSNIIQTVDDHYYLIDFEFMGNNDPIYDIATFGNGLVSEGRILLDYYFDHHPTKEEIKRYYLWRIYISLQWYNVAISKHYQGEGKTHGFNFLDVASHFLNNAGEARDSLFKELSLNIQ